MCEHKKVIFRTDDIKDIPEGYDKYMEQDDIDLETLEGCIENVTICFDCGEVLSDQS